eukprot:6344397-Prymnesium_polylepis.1
MSCSSGSTDCVAALLEFGAKTDRRARNGQTPAQVATSADFPECATLITEHEGASLADEALR